MLKHQFHTPFPVLASLTRSLLKETDFGRAGQFQTLWSSMEELLVSYNDKPFVSETYRASLDAIGGRAEKARHLLVLTDVQRLASGGERRIDTRPGLRTEQSGNGKDETADDQQLLHCAAVSIFQATGYGRQAASTPPLQSRSAGASARQKESAK